MEALFDVQDAKLCFDQIMMRMPSCHADDTIIRWLFPLLCRKDCQPMPTQLSGYAKGTTTKRTAATIYTHRYIFFVARLNDAVEIIDL